MNEQLIKIETAREAFEKGFEPITSKHWVEGKDGEISTISDWEISKGKWDEDWYRPLGFYAATQSLLQKWLREKHNLHILFILTTNKYSWTITDLNKGDVFVQKYEEWIDVVQTYEEALEKGLQEALKLI